MAFFPFSRNFFFILSPPQEKVSVFHPPLPGRDKALLLSLAALGWYEPLFSGSIRPALFFLHSLCEMETPFFS